MNQHQTPMPYGIEPKNKNDNDLIRRFGGKAVWLNWTLEPKKDKNGNPELGADGNPKMTKIPRKIDGGFGSSTDSTSWVTYQIADEARAQFSGVGFVFEESLKMVGVDLDHCVNDGIVADPLINAFLSVANTYTEISPSGTGLHCFLQTETSYELAANKRPVKGYEDFPLSEIYTSGRYFTFTGEVFGENKEVATLSSGKMTEILSIIGYPWGKGTEKENQARMTMEITTPIFPDDQSLLDKIFSSKGGDKVRHLYEGDISEYNNDTSAGDLALCSRFAFWAGKDKEWMRKLWLGSPLAQREKTQTRLDYQESTLDKAIESCTEVYRGQTAEKTNKEKTSIEEIEEMLQQIPSDTPKIKLMDVLTPIFKELMLIEKITAETFITSNIKEYFNLSKEDAKKYVPHVKMLREQARRDAKKTKEEEAKLPLILNRDINYQEVQEAVLEIGIVNEETLKIITAVIVSAHLRLNPPLWLFFIGVPSSFKTELVGLFSSMDEVYTLDTLTENAFCSGYVPPDGSEPQDLLPLLDNKSFIIKDLNTLFSMNEETVKKILGDLTSIFDGKFEKFTATRGSISYTSLFSMIGCITPSILIKHYNYATMLGPRFFFLRLPELTEAELKTWLKKSWTEKNRKDKIIKTRQLVSSYGTQLVKKIKQYENNTETEEVRNTINRIAQFICKARGIAITSKSAFKNEKGEDVSFYEIKDWQVEQPWRILNQLKSLLRVLCFINGKDTIDEIEIELIRPIILSTMPVDRAEILGVLIRESGLTAKKLSLKIGKSQKTIQRTLKELDALGIVGCYKDLAYFSTGKAPWAYFIREDFSSFLHSPVPSPECMSLLREVIEGTKTAESDDDDEEEDATGVF